MPQADTPLRGSSFDFFRSTGFKMFVLLTLALLPLGVVALVASLQSIRAADVEKKALLRIAATQSARKLGAELMSDQTALKLAINTFALGRGDPDMCHRADSFLRSRASSDTRFAIYMRDGRRICGSYDGWRDGIPPERRFDPAAAELIPHRGLLMIRTLSNDKRLVALTFYDRAYLDQVTDPASSLQNRHTLLQQGNKRMDIGGVLAVQGRSVDSVSAPLPPTDITLTMVVRDPPVTLARALSLFLPLVMWFAAAAIGWFVVNRLLIRPLVTLRRAVAAYRPGEVMEPMRRMRTPAQEIADLGNTFREISEDVATHEAEMADSLERQRRLTREVHHRVKNNLQIIASLINLHSRSAEAPEAVDAYASIQRRVDALSVVHRNHYAELEENKGVGVRALVSELCASLRATAPSGAGNASLLVDSDQLYVTQDVAVPVAFLITELVELAMLTDPGSTVRISVHSAEEAGHATLLIASAAYRASPRMHAYLEARFGRILTGLSRQLRAPLLYDENEGSYAIDIMVNG
ncbi:sensor histidine kinase [Sphingobium phenoxybenzoativorans]|uniref:sensor histidine kinase n=1 Tax=Sphingobium phenoxybenzoativorans TaxID=1592790 RepID=UPI000B1A5C5D|nr:sensor histidine kinase [Sphingobium phenoxybenzoativorans]